jgi:hypothetical protein
MRKSILHKHHSHRDRLAVLSHSVECKGLTLEDLGVSGFEQTQLERRLWISANRIGEHTVEPIRDDKGRLTGRRCSFAD